jgi:hypothetical protein
MEQVGCWLAVTKRRIGHTNHSATKSRESWVMRIPASAISAMYNQLFFFIAPYYVNSEQVIRLISHATNTKLQLHLWWKTKSKKLFAIFDVFPCLLSYTILNVLFSREKERRKLRLQTCILSRLPVWRLYNLIRCQKFVTYHVFVRKSKFSIFI